MCGKQIILLLTSDEAPKTELPCNKYVPEKINLYVGFHRLFFTHEWINF